MAKYCESWERNNCSTTFDLDHGNGELKSRTFAKQLTAHSLLVEHQHFRGRCGGSQWKLALAASGSRWGVVPPKAFAERCPKVSLKSGSFAGSGRSGASGEHRLHSVPLGAIRHVAFAALFTFIGIQHVVFSALRICLCLPFGTESSPS